MYINDPMRPKSRGKLANTWHLSKISWSVLNKDRELLVMPVLSLVCMIPVCVVGFLATVALESTSGEETAENVITVIGVVVAMAVGIISVFFQGALVAGAYERMTGGDPTVGSALQVALKRISGLVPWAVITTTVGLILRALRGDDDNILFRLLASLLETAWAVVTFLTVPAIIVDAMGPIQAIKRSGALLRKTWGENVLANAGFGLLTFLLVLGGVIPLTLVAALLGSVLGTPGLIVGVGLIVIYIAALIVFFTALNAVYQTALYLYATTGSSPVGFEEFDMAESFVAK